MNTRSIQTVEPTTFVEPEGAHPAKQERSRLLRDKALAYSQELVRQDQFASTSMADIARTVGCSVGALYTRFRDKEALFASVVEVAMAKEVEVMKAQAAEGRYRDLPLRETVNLCVQDFMNFVLSNDAMIRALYLRATQDPAYWGIVRVAAFEMVQVWVDVVARAAGHARDRDYIGQVGIAFQFVSSSLVHAVLIDKPTRPLSRPQFLYWLNEMVMHFISLEVPAALRGTPVTRPVPQRSSKASAQAPAAVPRARNSKRPAQ